MVDGKLTGAHHADSLIIDEVRVPGCAGVIGMTFCPGRKDQGLFPGLPGRDLETDLESVRSWGAAAVVSLLDQHEFQFLQVEELSARVMALGMHWIHLPIEDGGIPNDMFEELWLDAGPFLKRLLGEGRRVLLHCKEGGGRTGTVAARLLLEMGGKQEEVIRTMRKTRPGTIGTVAQESYVRSLGNSWIDSADGGKRSAFRNFRGIVR